MGTEMHGDVRENKIAWAPGPKLPCAEDVARAFDFAAVVVRRAPEIDHLTFLQIVNKRPPRMLGALRSTIGLKGQAKLDRSAAKPLLKRLATPGAMQERILDELCVGAVAFGSSLTADHWLGLFRLETRPFCDATDGVKNALEALRSSISPDHEDCVVAIDLADGVRRGAYGSAMALGLLAELEDDAMAAYVALTRNFSDLPSRPVTRAELRTHLDVLLDGTMVPGVKGTPGQEAPRGSSPLPANASVGAEARMEAHCDTPDAVPGSAPVDLCDAENLAGSRWDEASAAAEMLAEALSADRIPAGAGDVLHQLSGFMFEVTGLAAALDVATRAELRTALEELRKQNVDPARRWLLRLAAMEGPVALANSIAAVSQIAEEAAALARHERDEPLVALLTLIDLAADRASGRDASWQAGVDALRAAVEGLPEYQDLVFAAGQGDVTAPQDGARFAIDEIQPTTVQEGGEPTSSSRNDADAEEFHARTDVPSDVASDVRDSAASDVPDDDAPFGVSPAHPVEPADTPVEAWQGTIRAGVDRSNADVALPVGVEVVGATAATATRPPESQLEANVVDSPPASIETTEPCPTPGRAQEYKDGSDPWVDGEPPEIAELILARREGLAFQMARAHGIDDARVRALAFLAGANTCPAERLVGELGPIWPDAEQIERLSANDCRILLAAETRIALSLGFDPTGQLESVLSSVLIEDYEGAEHLGTIVRMAAHGFQRPVRPADFSSIRDQWLSMRATAHDVSSSLNNSKINFHRATHIIRHLARDNEPLGAHLRLLEAIVDAHIDGRSPDPVQWQTFSDFSALLQDVDEQTRLIDNADRRVNIASRVRKPIVASAKTRMYALIDGVAELSASVVALHARTRNPAAGGAQAGDASVYLTARAGLVPAVVRSVGDAALQRLIEWIREDAPEEATAASLEECLERELAPLFELPRDKTGRHGRVPSTTEIEVLKEGREPLDVVRGYLGTGNVRAAEDYIALSPLVRTDQLNDEVREAVHDLRKQCKARFAEVSRAVSRIRALHEDSDENDSVLTFAGRLAVIDEQEPDDRIDLTFAVLEQIESEAAEVLESIRTGLRSRAQGVESRADRQRIIDLIEIGDEPLAVEYLTLSESGAALPSLEPVSAEDFANFFPEVVNIADEARRARQDPLAAVRRALGQHGEPDVRRLLLGLNAWRAIAKEKQGSKYFRENVASVLRMLGLNPDPVDWLNATTRTKNAGFASFAVRAKPADGSYVPLFGTKALGRYDLTLVWEEVKNPQSLLQKIDVDRTNEPNIILYFGTLSVEQRIQLRKLTKRSEFSPLVIDEAVVGWLSTLEEPGWKLTQRVTLPFTTINPYVTVGDVPDEMFVGRESERRAIIDPSGSMFVYGGRQLGKSALLRRVERGLNREADRVSVVYIDLKAANLGEAAPASELWHELAVRLEKMRILEARRQKWSADEVIQGIESWLDIDDSRRLLLLLDEADNFLTYDATDTGRDGVGGFPVLQRLKGLMENSQRRFKPVFAGLHQVQRFHDMPNTPVAHGGDDILIGPLSFSDARRLVAPPLRALGFEFESAETVWRLLLLTNYQASLIQIVCEALVDHLRSESLPKGGGRIVITSQHVEDVYAKRAVRDRIRDRFRWTINLDNRYRVIALVTSLLTFDAAPGEGFSPAELQETCAAFWPAGFARATLSSSEFRRYLEEMRGLGVLHHQDDGNYVLRSPNIRGLLGTKQQVEDELIEASETLEVEYKYNPTMNRRILEHVDGRDGNEVRSPLPDADLVKLLDRKDPIQFVVGTQALGLGRVTGALKKVASEGRIQIVDVPVDKIPSKLRSAYDDHLIVDLTDKRLAAERIESAIQKLASAPGVTCTVILQADGPFDVTTVIERFPHVSLSRWTEDGLGTWQDSAFPTPTLRRRLKRATGGWPRNIEQAMRLVAEGASPAEALTEVRQSVSDERSARSFLQSAGVNIDAVMTWVRWFGQAGADGLYEVPPVGLDLLDDTDEFERPASEIVAGLQLVDAVDETNEGFVLDRFVVDAVRCLLA